MGTGTLTVVAAVVAESWGIPIERVHLVHGDTDALPNDTEAGASRMTNVAGHTVIAACDQVKEQLAPLAAEMLGAEHPVWETPGWRGEDGRFVSLEELARAMIKPGDPLAHARVTLQVPAGKEPERSVQAAEVEVDSETGQVTVRKLVTAQAVGTIINETAHQGQIEGCVVQGFGYAMTEELVIEEGRVLTGNLGDYKLPTMADVPPLTTVNLPTPGRPVQRSGGRRDSRGAHARGHRQRGRRRHRRPVMDLPITAERILDLLDRKPSR